MEAHLGSGKRSNHRGTRPPQMSNCPYYRQCTNDIIMQRKSNWRPSNYPDSGAVNLRLWLAFFLFVCTISHPTFIFLLMYSSATGWCTVDSLWNFTGTNRVDFRYQTKPIANCNVTWLSANWSRSWFKNALFNPHSRCQASYWRFFFKANQWITTSYKMFFKEYLNECALEGDSLITSII